MRVTRLYPRAHCPLLAARASVPYPALHQRSNASDWRMASRTHRYEVSEWGVRFVYGVGSAFFVMGAVLSLPEVLQEDSDAETGMLPLPQTAQPTP